MAKAKMTVEEAAEYKNVIPGTINRWIRLGVLPSYLSSGIVTVIKADLDLIHMNQLGRLSKHMPDDKTVWEIYFKKTAGRKLTAKQLSHHYKLDLSLVRKIIYNCNNEKEGVIRAKFMQMNGTAWNCYKCDWAKKVTGYLDSYYCPFTNCVKEKEGFKCGGLD